MSENWRIDSKDIRLEELIGEGYFGKVYKASWNGIKVAVKIQKTLPAHHHVSFFDEFNSLINIRHPKLVQFLGTVSIDNFTNYLVFEFMNYGSLFHLLHSQDCRLTLLQRLHLSLDIASALCYLHSLKSPLIHRDLTSSNILLSMHNDELEAKVSDFGLSRKLVGSEQATISHGNLLYLAPESYLNGIYAKSSDIYSFGIILNEIFSEKTPYSGKELNPNTAAYKAAVSNFRPTLASNIPELLSSLIQSCWHTSPSKRPEFKEIVNALERISNSFIESIQDPNSSFSITIKSFTPSQEYIALDTIESSPKSPPTLQSSLSTSRLIRSISERIHNNKSRHLLEVPPLVFPTLKPHICHYSTSCTIYPNLYPNIEDLIVCEIIDNSFGVTSVKLLEFEPLIGKILIDELSVKKINPVTEIAKIGAKLVLQVKKVDFHKKLVDLQRQNLNAQDELIRILQFEKLLPVHSILIEISSRYYLCPFCLHDMYIWKSSTIHPFEAFRAALSNSSDLFGPFNKCKCISLSKSLHLNSSLSNRLESYISSQFELTNIDLSSLGLSSFPSNFFPLTPSNICYTLNLSFNNLTELPKELSKMSLLQELNCNNCFLSNLPFSLIELHSLQYLYLYSNDFSEFPIIICKLYALKELTIGRNSIKVIPKEIEELIQLEKINLSYNNLKDLPSSFSKLINLVSLSLSFNSFKNFPFCLFSLSGLQKLDFEGNEITDLCSQENESTPLNLTNFSELSALQFLNFRNNHLSSFDFASLPISLNYLDISNNPISLNDAQQSVHSFLPNLTLVHEDLKMKNSESSVIPSSPNNVSSWGAAEVYNWIVSLFPNEMYHEQFLSNEINGKALLLLTRDDLSYLGITKLGHVVLLLDNISKFNAYSNTEISTSAVIETKDISEPFCDIKHCENIKTALFLSIKANSEFQRASTVFSLVEIISLNESNLDKERIHHVIDSCNYYLSCKLPSEESSSFSKIIEPVDGINLLSFQIDTLFPKKSAEMILETIASSNKVLSFMNFQLSICIEPIVSNYNEIQAILRHITKKSRGKKLSISE